LQQVRVGGPGLGPFTGPGSQKADADLAVLVEVRVEPVRDITDVMTYWWSLKSNMENNLFLILQIKKKSRGLKKFKKYLGIIS
jgi:hypothetical protein